MGDVLQGRGQRRLPHLQHGPVVKAFLLSIGFDTIDLVIGV